ncbi:MAG TPA: sulfite oxidase [Candidatus Acidoferrales bacterium]|nr:sulfite oxidase [Candidatus Acidoferrales bacterium]
MSDDLVYLTRDPLNAEVRPERITGAITPVGTHYVRDHFPIPEPPSHLEVGGLVETPLRLTVAELRALPPRTLTVTLECAGNGRAYLDPPAPGEQWHLGAVGTAEWTGVPLRALLDHARPKREAVELLFVGADHGMQKDVGRDIAFERSLPMADALGDGPLLAYAMNGAPLAPEHGAPLRLIVPRWYGVASVKWLARVTAIAERFAGFYQKDRYVIDGRPLREIAPRAIITSPADGARVARGRVAVHGKAWSGRSPIGQVEVSLDSGYSWHHAQLGPQASAVAWRDWSITLETGDRDELSILAFATTTDGEQQPIKAVANPLGYSNNAARSIRVTIG